MGRRYSPCSVLLALHPFHWCGNPDIGADVVSGYYCYMIKLGDRSLSQLGVHLPADRVQVRPCISLVLCFFHYEVKAACY